MGRRESFTAKQIHLERLAHDDLKEFWVDWDDIAQGHVSAFKRALGAATSERPIQAYLDKHPLLLIQHLGGGHGRYVIPKLRLGAEFVPDFVIGERRGTRPRSPGHRRQRAQSHSHWPTSY